MAFLVVVCDSPSSISLALFGSSSCLISFCFFGRTLDLKRKFKQKRKGNSFHFIPTSQAKEKDGLYNF